MKKLFSTFAFILFFIVQFTFSVDDCKSQWVQTSDGIGLNMPATCLKTSGNSIYAGV